METLKLIVLLENLMGIYRNFSSLGKLQNLVFYRIIFEISVLIACLTFYIECSDNLIVIQIFYSMSYINSLLIICLSVYYSEEFSQIVKQQKDFNACFPTDVIYKRKYDSRKKVIYYCLLAYNLYCFFSYTTYYVQLNIEDIFKCSVYIFYLIEIIAFLNDLRFIIEIPIISVFYYAMLDQLDAISRSLNIEIHDLMRFKAKHRFDDTFYSRHSKNIIFDNLSTAYNIVEKKSKLYEKIFGFQLTVSAASIITFYVLSLYGMVIFGVEGDFTPQMLFMFFYSLAQYIAILFMLSRAAQLANNSADALRQQLCKLLVHSLGCKKQYKATRDFLRLVLTHPIQTRAFGSIDVDITLLPTCIVICISYTIIALQFNNVL